MNSADTSTCGDKNRSADPETCHNQPPRMQHAGQVLTHTCGKRAGSHARSLARSLGCQVKKRGEKRSSGSRAAGFKEPAYHSFLPLEPFHLGRKKKIQQYFDLFDRIYDFCFFTVILPFFGGGGGRGGLWKHIFSDEKNLSTYKPSDLGYKHAYNTTREAYILYPLQRVQL